MSISIRFGKTCVYCHRLPDGTIFYVGMGKANRPFDPSNRNSIWHETVAMAGHIDVEIIGWYDSRLEAEIAERKAIINCQPSANLTLISPEWLVKRRRGMILKRHIEKMSWLGYRRVNDLYERVEPSRD